MRLGGGINITSIVPIPSDAILKFIFSKMAMLLDIIW